MTRSAPTGTAAPAWVVEEIRRQEAAWPLRALAAAAGVAALATALAGGWIWNAGDWICYARP
jgi:histidinol-phosphate/aromatic aminotransferase/cobyric acid decarboxylase-like protein